MAKYSIAHERDECAKMWRGFWHSTFGILLCWLPGLGLILAISGFARQVVRMTEKYRKRLILFTVYALLSLMLCIGAILGGLYAYSRDPQVLHTAATWIWKQVTGQDALPGEVPPTDYSGQQYPGLGVYLDDSDLDGEPDDGDDDLVDDEYFTGDEEEDIDDEDDDALDGKSLGGGAALPEDTYEEDEEDEEDDLDYPDYEFDFDFYCSDEEYFEADGQECVTYKVVIEKDEPTDEDLYAVFDEVVYDDGFYLHNVYIYRYENDTDGSFTVAALEQKTEGEPPVLTRK